MIVVPFIYFIILLIYIIKKKRSFHISAYVVSLYAISSFFSILIDVNNFRSFDTRGYEISVVPTILYCLLLTVTIWPFYRIKSEKIISIKLNKPKLFNKIVYFYFACFLLTIISSFNSIIQVLTGNLGAMRAALYGGESITQSSNGHGVLHPLFLVANIFGGFSLIMLLFYFYSICFLNRSKNFNRMILVSSFTIVVLGILGVDRSKAVYWMITYGFMLILFWRHMPKKQRKNIYSSSIIILGLILFYFLAVTVSRFGHRDTGVKGGMISYAGQSFINFCYFFDKVDYNGFSLHRIFPLYYKLFVHDGILSNNDLNTEISLKTGTLIAVFSTFMGDIMVASGKFVMIAYCLIFSLIARNVIIIRNMYHVYFYQILFIFCLITIPMLGIFVHFYANFPRVIALFCFLLYGFHLKLSRFKR